MKYKSLCRVGHSLLIPFVEAGTVFQAPLYHVICSKQHLELMKGLFVVYLIDFNNKQVERFDYSQTAKRENSRDLVDQLYRKRRISHFCHNYFIVVVSDDQKVNYCR